MKVSEKFFVLGAVDMVQVAHVCVSSNSELDKVGLTILRERGSPTKINIYQKFRIDMSRSEARELGERLIKMSS